MDEVKIFVTYYKNKSDAPIIKSSVFQPIMAGSAEISGNINNAFLRDDTGDNISNLNERYGELTIHYWLLRNYLANAKERYIGVCHYRRFLEFCGSVELNLGNETNFSPLHLVYYKYFTDYIFSKYDEKTILSAIENYDVLTTRKWFFDNKNNRVIFDYYHRSIEMDFALKALERINPEYLQYASDFFKENDGYYCMCTVMKRELLEDYFNFEFEILDEMKKDNCTSRWEKYNEYRDIRTPAFLMERLYNVWLRYKVDRNKIKVLELPGCKLISPNEAAPPKKVKFLKEFSAVEKNIDSYYLDKLSARHPKLNKILRLLVKKDDYNKLLGDPKSFFFDAQSLIVRLIGTIYK